MEEARAHRTYSTRLKEQGLLTDEELLAIEAQ